MDIVAWLLALILATGAIAYGLTALSPFVSPTPKRSESPKEADRCSDDLPCDDGGLFAQPRRHR